MYTVYSGVFAAPTTRALYVVVAILFFFSQSPN